MNWEELKRKSFVIQCDQHAFQCALWLKRQGANIDVDSLPGSKFLLVNFPNVSVEEECSSVVKDKFIFTGTRFMRTFVYTIKHCKNPAHEIFEDAITTLANFGVDNYRIWFSSLTKSEQEQVYSEFLLHENEIVNNLK